MVHIQNGPLKVHPKLLGIGQNEGTMGPQHWSSVYIESIHAFLAVGILDTSPCETWIDIESSYAI